MERQRRYQDKHVNEDLPVLLIGDTVRVARFPGFKKWLHATGNNRHQWPRSDVAEHNGESTDATDDTSTVNDRGRPNTLTNRASNQDQAQPIDSKFESHSTSIYHTVRSAFRDHREDNKHSNCPALPTGIVTCSGRVSTTTPEPVISDQVSGRTNVTIETLQAQQGRMVPA